MVYKCITLGWFQGDLVSLDEVGSLRTSYGRLVCVGSWSILEVEYWRNIVGHSPWKTSLGWKICWWIWVVICWLGGKCGCRGDSKILLSIFWLLPLSPGGATASVGGILTLVYQFFHCPYAPLVVPILSLPVFLFLNLMLLLLFSLLLGSS